VSEQRGGACADCLRRAWLLAALAGHIGNADPRRERLGALLALPDMTLIDALGGRKAGSLRARHEQFDAAAAREECARAGLAVTCRHDELHPDALGPLPDAPAVLHVAGTVERLAELTAEPAVAVVGARRASPYGLEVAHGLGRGLAAAGLTVVSGLALGVDSAGHAGALEAGGRTIAVLAGGADVPYPPSKRRLYGRLLKTGCAISEMPPGFAPQRWSFVARNRIIAGLAAATVVVEASERSGALITAGFARSLGREVGAVPGHVTSPLAQGTNALLFDGALVVRDAGDVLDLVLGPGIRPARAPRDPALEPRLARMLDAVASGRDTLGALASASSEAAEAMVALAELEILGYLRRGAGGRYTVVADPPSGATAPVA